MDSSAGCAIVGVKKGELDTDTDTDTEGARLEETEVFQSREHRDYWSAAIELHRMEPLDRNLTGRQTAGRMLLKPPRRGAQSSKSVFV